MRFSAIWGVLFFLTVSNNTEARDFNYKSIWKSGCPQTEKAWVCDSNKNLCMAFYFMPNASEHLSVEINYDGATTNVKDCEKSIRAPDGFFSPKSPLNAKFMDINTGKVVATFSGYDVC